MMGLLGDNRLAAGHDLGGLLRAAKHGQTASATGPSPRGQDADRHCVACRSRINLPLHRPSAAGTARLYSYSERWGTGRNCQPSYQQIGANDNARRTYDEVREGRAGTYRGPQTFGVMQDGTGKAPLTLGDPLLVEQSLALYVR